MKLQRCPLPYVVVIAVVLTLAPGSPAGHEDRVHVSPESDARAIEIAQGVVEKMGGWEAWDRTRYLSWNFFGNRRHHWDRHTGDIRVEGVVKDHELLWLMNVDTGEGRVWRDGDEIAADDDLETWLETGRQIWVNDSYWLVMPFKMLDPGVTLKYSGERELEDGRPADVLDLTFGEGVGYTPQNRYEVFVAKDTGLVEQWAFFAEASETEPRFTLPWAAWKTFGEIRIATDHGQGKDWDVAVHDELDAAVFREP